VTPFFFRHSWKAAIEFDELFDDEPEPPQAPVNRTAPVATVSPSTRACLKRWNTEISLK
jgi:hypothetical protein